MILPTNMLPVARVATQAMEVSQPNSFISTLDDREPDMSKARSIQEPLADLSQIRNSS